jgi:spoIIIJ-associated protein
MSGLLSKLFGSKKKEDFRGANPEELVHNVLVGIIERAGLDLHFDMRSEKVEDVEDIHIEMSGPDEAFLTERDGQLLDSFQLLLKRSVQHQMTDANVNVHIDCNGWREDNNRSLVELADKLKDKALEQGRSVYFRALPPKDRKVVHQHLANDARIRSRSVGEGLYKKIKIYPTKEDGSEASEESSAPENA